MSKTLCLKFLQIVYQMFRISRNCLKDQKILVIRKSSKSLKVPKITKKNFPKTFTVRQIFAFTFTSPRNVNDEKRAFIFAGRI